MRNTYVRLAFLAFGMAGSLALAVPPSLNARFGLPDEYPWPLQVAATSPAREEDAAAAERNGPDVLSAAACHAGAGRLLLKIGFATPPQFSNSSFIVYLDLDNDPDTGRTDAPHRGVDVMVSVSGDSVRADARNPDYRATKVAGWAEGTDLWLAVDAPLRAGGQEVVFGMHLLAQRQGARGDSTTHTVVRVPVGTETALTAGELGGSSALRSLSDYRFHNDTVKLLPLADKGLSAADVAVAQPLVLRPRPPLPLEPMPAGIAGMISAVPLREVELEVLEEAGVARDPAWFTFGLPLAEGALYHPAWIGVLGPNGQRLPVQAAISARWPDGSPRWVQVTGRMPLKAKERAICRVQFGEEVQPSAAMPLAVDRGDGLLTVRDGANRFTINTRRFNLLQSAVVDGRESGGFAPDGVVLIDEAGTRFTTAGVPPQSVSIEQHGPLQLVVRVAGDYADGAGKRYMSYITRLTFRPGSSRVGIVHTNINTYTATEFTDIQSLGVSLVGAAPFTRLQGRVAGEGESAAGRALAQWTADDMALDNGAERTPGRLTGAIVAEGERPVTAVLRDCWQRWPKAFALVDGALHISLLPKLPSTRFGEGMPHYLLFPFVDGFYRMKWGMAFTEDMTVDFAGSGSLPELTAEVELPVVGVLPAAYYAETQAAGRLAAPMGKQFAHWDAYVADGFARHLQRKETGREYGFLNYGDWYGERGRNWGNNEYDLAHGLFHQFLRTGNRAYLRWGQVAARHQADVDCVHAYPDPAYVGANHQHSIGHTGTWSDAPKRATWTHRYDAHTSAENGHTWAEGMVDSWWLTGDPRPMESAIGLGEHIAWAMAPQFRKLGTHERSAGWSLKAILAVYAACPDPAYLAAAKQIAAVALAEQKLDRGGAWPHPLPIDHAGGHPGAVGNNLFLIGVLLEGLKDYHEATHDPATARALIAAVDWVLKSFDPTVAGWPYSASETGEPYYPPSTGFNLLVIDSVAYVGKLTGRADYSEVAAKAFAAILTERAPAMGKSLAQRLVYAGTTLAYLQEYFATADPERGGLLLSDDGFMDAIVRIPDAARFSVRSPTVKVFHVQTTGAAPVLTGGRTPHGARPKEMSSGTLVVTDAAGAEVARQDFDTDRPYACRIPLPGLAGGVYRVVVTDDERSVWTFAGEDVGVVAEVVKGFSIGGVGRSRYHFRVPVDCTVFSVRIEGVHPGEFGGAVVTPGGAIAALYRGSNDGNTQLDWAQDKAGKALGHAPVAVLAVEPAAADRGKVWDLLLWAKGDIRCELQGMPPLLSCRQGDWFLPALEQR